MEWLCACWCLQYYSYFSNNPLHLLLPDTAMDNIRRPCTSILVPALQVLPIVTIFWGRRGIKTYYSLTNNGDNGNIPEGKSQGAKPRVIFPQEYCHYLTCLSVNNMYLSHAVLKILLHFVAEVTCKFQFLKELTPLKRRSLPHRIRQRSQLLRLRLQNLTEVYKKQLSNSPSELVKQTSPEPTFIFIAF